jgi:hypothetical protein
MIEACVMRAADAFMKAEHATFPFLELLFTKTMLGI